MAKSDLLKQAIADAKTVKETALANAKLALQEAFVPRITQMFAEKLEAGMDLDEEDEEGMSADAAAPAAEPADVEGGEGEDFTWTDDSLAASVGGKDYSFQVGMAGGAEEKMAADTAEPAAPSDEEMTAEYNEGYHEDAHSDLDISEIIRELEEDAAMDDPMTNPMDLEEDMYFEKEYPELEKGIEDMHGGMDAMGPGSDIDEIIESILREVEDQPATSMDKLDPTKTTADLAAPTQEEEVIEAMEAELADKEVALEEAYRTVKYLQSVINEVNLLNAKLLYTNKLFRNFELSESQKMKIIENFDRATNTREAKLVFATLAESFKRPTKKRVVKESYASKATSTTAPSKQTTQILSEGFEMANRWKKLAGLL